MKQAAVTALKAATDIVAILNVLEKHFDRKTETQVWNVKFLKKHLAKKYADMLAANISAHIVIPEPYELACNEMYLQDAENEYRYQAIMAMLAELDQEDLDETTESDIAEWAIEEAKRDGIRIIN